MFGDSLDALRGLLKSAFPTVPKIYVSTMPGNFVRPSFFVNLATSSEEHLSRDLYQVDMTWQIVYFAPLDEKHQVNVFDQLQVSEQLKKVLMDNMVLTYIDPARKATGYIEVTGSADTIIPAGIIVKTAKGIQFETLTAATIENETIEIVIQALKAGVSGNVASDTVTVMAEPIVGIVSITNPEPICGGIAEESVVYHIIETEGGPRDAEVYITVTLQTELTRPRPEYDLMNEVNHEQEGS